MRERNLLGLIDDYFKYIALLPLIAMLLLLVIAPVTQLISMSFSRASFAAGGISFSPVGLANYQTAIRDPIAIRSLWNTAVLAIVGVTFQTIIAVTLAILVGYAARGNFFYRTVFIFPMLLPPIAIGVMWLMIYNFNYGVLNEVLSWFGVSGPPWLAHTQLAFPAVIVTDIWHWTSFVFLIVLAGVETLPHELSESARIDGAKEKQIVRHILLPLLKPIIIVAIVTRLVFAFKVYERIYLLTDGGPGNRTEVITSYIMRVYFEHNRLGYAASLAVLTLLIITALIAVVFLVQRMTAQGRQ